MAVLGTRRGDFGVDGGERRAVPESFLLRKINYTFIRSLYEFDISLKIQIYYQFKL